MTKVLCSERYFSYIEEDLEALEDKRDRVAADAAVIRELISEDLDELLDGEREDALRNLRIHIADMTNATDEYRAICRKINDILRGNYDPFDAGEEPKEREVDA